MTRREKAFGRTLTSGGPMSEQEVANFRQHKFAEDAIRLRKWDDAAKIPGLETPPLSHFAEYLSGVANEDSLP